MTLSKKMSDFCDISKIWRCKSIGAASIFIIEVFILTGQLFLKITPEILFLLLNAFILTIFVSFFLSGIKRKYSIELSGDQTLLGIGITFVGTFVIMMFIINHSWLQLIDSNIIRIMIQSVLITGYIAISFQLLIFRYITNNDKSYTLLLGGINPKIILMLFGFLLLIAVGAITSYQAVKQQKGDALLYNLASRQRMLAIKMVQDDLLDYLMGTVDTLPGSAKSETSKFKRPIDDPYFLFEQTARAMLYGGNITSDMFLSMQSDEKVNKISFLNDEKSRDYLIEALDKVTTIRNFTANLSPKFTLEERQTAAKIILEKETSIVHSIDNLVNRLQEVTENKVARLNIIQKLSSIVTLILFVFLVVFVQQKAATSSALQESENKYRSLFEYSKDAIYISNREGKFIDVNQAAIDLFGYSKEEIIKLDVNKLYANTVDRMRFQQKIDQKGSVSGFEIKLRKKDGTIMDCLITSTVRRDKDVIIQGYEGIIRDITARKQSERIQSMLLHIAQTTSEGKDINNLLAKIQFEMEQLFEARNFDVVLYNEDKDSYYFAYSKDEYDDVNFSQQELSNSLIDYVRRTGEPLIVDEDKQNELVKLGEVSLVGTASAIWMGAPLKTARGVIGVITVQSYTEPKAYTENDLELLSFVSKHIAMVIERKQAEEDLHRSKNFIETVFNSITDSISVYDVTNYKIAGVNKAFLDVTNKEEKEIIGQFCYKINHDKSEPCPSSKCSILKVKKTGKNVIAEHVFNNEDRTEKYVEVLTSPIRDQNGEIYQVINIARDITERKQAEKLQTSTYKISQSAQSAVNLNELFLSIHNIIRELMPAKNFFIALYDDKTQIISFPYFVDEYDETPKPKKLRRGLTEYVLRTRKPLLAKKKDIKKLVEKEEIEVVGTLPIDWLGVPLNADNKTIGLFAVQNYEKDVHLTHEHKKILRFVSAQVAMAIQRKQAGEELLITNKNLAKANARANDMMQELVKAQDELKLALDLAEESDMLKSEFLANTSHELRTPLNSIIGFLQLILDGMCDTVEEEREFTSNALQSSHHLLGLINDVLDIAKIEAGKVELDLKKININEIFEEVLVLTHVQAEQKKIKLNFLIDENKKIYVKADYQKIKQVLLNLLGNSLKFTLKGSITISSESVLEKGFAKIQVIDTGIGIPKTKQNRIFEKFTQVDGSTSRKFGGSGLGLSITKSLVELMGGTIELTSAGLNKGTVVTFTIPLAEDVTKKTQKDITPIIAKKTIPESTQVHAKDGNGYLDNNQIVIVEDNEAVSLYLKNFLQESGYETFTADTAYKGFNLIKEVLPQCAIIDYGLPVETNSALNNGLSLIAALQENKKTQHIPTILVTGYEEQVHNQLSLGSAVLTEPIVLGKPLDSNRLLQFVDSICNQNGKSSLNILLADDDPNVGKYLQKIFSKNGHKMATVENGKLALDYLKNDQNNIDILLLDLMMPVMDGFEVIKELKLNQKAKELPIIIVTNYLDVSSAEHKKLLSKDIIMDLVSKEELNKNPNMLLELLDTVTKKQVNQS